MRCISSYRPKTLNFVFKQALAKIQILALLLWPLMGCQSNIDNTSYQQIENTDITSMQLWLPQSSNVDAQQVTRQLIERTARLSQQIALQLDLNNISLYLVPDRTLNQGQFSLSADDAIHYNYHPDRLDPQFSQQLAYQLYLALRLKFDPTDTALNKVVNQGLALHFVADVTQSQTPMQQQTLTEKQLKHQFALLQQNKPITVESKPLGYQLVKRHFEQYPGSNAGNTYTLNHQLFSRYLTETEKPTKKTLQFVRTAKATAPQIYRNLDWANSPYKGLVFLEGWNRQKLIALTFDDGPFTYTEQILNTLQAHKVKASFFWIGNRLEQNKALVLRAKHAGHTIANHSWSHSHTMALLPDELWREQIDKTNLMFKQIIGHKPRFYRPPYGEITEQQIEYIGQQGMKIMIWSIDPRDWDTDNVNSKEIESVIIDNLHPETI
ncbi:MAG: polysaccharide deacetylase family protein, partial [Psychrosphaera sp.]|nr:polysaccharide deacetylase family protein [Psychrosphaera sp.]